MPSPRVGCLTATLVVAASLGLQVGPAVAGDVPRGVAYWQRIADSAFAVPAGETAAGLLGELDGLLASTDPDVRDGLGYGIAEQWIYRKKLVSGSELAPLAERWAANLRAGVGEQGTPTVYKRSFSALVLSLVAAADASAPALTPAQHASLVDAALAYLRDERDLRDYDAVAGWAHATAHTADLLKFLARRPSLPVADHARMLAAIRERLASAGSIFTHGEPDRLAQAAVSLVRRPDFDESALTVVLARVEDDGKRLWAAPPRIDPGLYGVVQNEKQFLQALFVSLSRVPADPRVERIRAAVLVALAGL